MIEIECPHCNGDIELDDDDSGLFNCPYCDQEFLWEHESKIMDANSSEDTSKSDYSHLVLPSILISVFLGILVFIFWWINAYANAMACGWSSTC